MSARQATAVVAGGAAVAALLVMVAPAAIQDAQDRMDQTLRYPTGAAAKAGGAEVPNWLPDTAVRVAFLTGGEKGDRLIRATLPDRSLPAGCTAGGPVGAVHLRAHWFPTDVPKKAGAHCGLYDVVLIGDQLYGWQDAAVVAGARPGGMPLH
ncbi:hypothetical protein ACFV4P_08680 [Kitasatospora sp. NPDC059795]|uniref:hypothetical protein n=1 Tax=unclassified Kitasatospora TaxID=2633591 RepID=UPI00093A2AB2|nr:hypothetical protein [Kitasatospora sp. CB01950]